MAIDSTFFSTSQVRPTPAEITFRKSGTILEVSVGGSSPLPDEVRRLLEPNLRYTKVEHLYGRRRYEESHDGSPRRVKTTVKHLYRYDERGRFICGFGFHSRVRRILADAGYQVRVVVKDPPRERPDCYVPDWSAVRKRFTFRQKQEDCLRAIADNPCGLVHATTGFGKMVMIAMMCVLFPRAKFIIVVRGRSLARKIREFLMEWVPGVGLVGDGSRQFGRVTVYVAASLHHCPFDADFLLCDEAHEVIAEESSRWLAKSLYTRNYAFSASPTGRADGADVRMESLFGPRVFHLPYPEAVALGLVVPIRVEWADVRLDRNPAAGLVDTPRQRWGLWRNADRNAVVAARAKSFADDEQVQVLVDKIEHAVYLRQHLPGFTLVYGEMEMDDREMYVRQGLLPADEPKMTPEYRNNLRKEFEAGRLKKVITTGVWAVGIDPVQLAAIVRADAGGSEILDIQAPGRVSRTHTQSGKSVGVVCDFRDQFDSSFAGKAKKRLRHYEAMGWEQVVVQPGGDLLPISG